jgi:hypothetical protein
MDDLLALKPPHDPLDLRVVSTETSESLTETDLFSVSSHTDAMQACNDTIGWSVTHRVVSESWQFLGRVERCDGKASLGRLRGFLSCILHQAPKEWKALVAKSLTAEVVFAAMCANGMDHLVRIRVCRRKAVRHELGR